MPVPPARIIHQSPADHPLGGITLAGHGAVDTKPAAHYALIYILSGEGRIDDQPLARADLLALLPGTTHAFTGQLHAFYVHFAGPIFDAWRSAGMFDTLVTPLSPTATWLPRLEHCVESTRPLDQIVRLQQFLADVAHHRLQRHASPGDRKWLSAAQALLDRIDTANVEWESIAAQLGLSYDSFRKRFTRLASISPGRYHAERLIERSCELLRRPDATNRDIASSLGFCDAFHFSRRFKQVTGLSPTEFRRRGGKSDLS